MLLTTHNSDEVLCLYVRFTVLTKMTSMGPAYELIALTRANYPAIINLRHFFGIRRLGNVVPTLRSVLFGTVESCLHEYTYLLVLLT
jgi:hypothetical protein